MLAMSNGIFDGDFLHPHPLLRKLRAWRSSVADNAGMTARFHHIFVCNGIRAALALILNAGNKSAAP
jgi:hypothetical protein